MKLAVYTIFSELHVKEKLKSYEETFLKSINENLKDNELVITRGIDEFNKYDLGLILVLSGGSENKFKEVYNKLKAPYYILSYFKNNSLAASLEIAAYVRNNNKEVEVLHGDATYISNRIYEIVNFNNNQKEKI